MCFGFQAKPGYDNVTQFINSKFFSSHEAIEPTISGGQHVLIWLTIPSECLFDLGTPPCTVVDDRTYWGTPIEMGGSTECHAPPIFEIYACPKLKQQEAIRESGRDYEVSQITFPLLIMNEIASRFVGADKFNERMFMFNDVSQVLGIAVRQGGKGVHPMIGTINHSATLYLVEHAHSFTNKDSCTKTPQLLEWDTPTVLVACKTISAHNDGGVGNETENRSATIECLRPREIIHRTIGTPLFRSLLRDSDEGMLAEVS
jgi:hypothetical protein